MQVIIQALEHSTADNLHIKRHLRIEDRGCEMLTEKYNLSWQIGPIIFCNFNYYLMN